MATKSFVVLEFERNNRGRLVFIDTFSVVGTRSAKAVLKDPATELNTVFVVYEVVDGELVKFG